MASALKTDSAIQAVLKALPESAELFVVGGAVRDALLNRPLTDLDLVARTMSLLDLKAALTTLGTVHTNGEQWGVLSLTLGGRTVDVALPREETTTKADGSYFATQAQPNPELPIETDLQRRDFSVNAMAFNARTGELVDPYYGQEDIRHKVLRTVGNPVTRFTEDHSRILRCLRFATQLGFAIEPITWEGLRSVVAIAGQLRIPKRIWEREFSKAHSDLEIFHDWLKKAGIEPTHV